MRRTTVAALATIVVALSACGTAADRIEEAVDDLADAVAADDAVAGEDAPEPDAEPDSAAGGDEGDCDLVTADEVTAVFEGRITETNRSGHGPRGGGCQIFLDVEGDSGSVLVVQVLPADHYHTILELVESDPTAAEEVGTRMVDVGAGGVLQQRTNLDVLVDDQTALRVGAQLILFDQSTGQPYYDDADAYLDRVSDNLIDLARTVVGRL